MQHQNFIVVIVYECGWCVVIFVLGKNFGYSWKVSCYSDKLYPINEEDWVSLDGGRCLQWVTLWWCAVCVVRLSCGTLLCRARIFNGKSLVPRVLQQTDLEFTDPVWRGVFDSRACSNILRSPGHSGRPKWRARGRVSMICQISKSNQIIVQKIGPSADQN